MSHAAWKTLRDASNGWVGELQLVSSDSANQILAFSEFAIPWDATPTVHATFLTAGDTQGTAVAAKSSFVNWSGARILHLNLSLSAAQRHVQNLSGHRVRLTLSWKGSSGAALLPIVRNTILNPRGGSRFGKFSVASRASSGSLPQLFEASQPTLVLDIGDLTKRNDRQVSRTDDNGIFRLTGKDLRKIFGNLNGSSLANISVYCSARDTLPSSAAASPTAPALQAVAVQRITSGNGDTIRDDDEIRFYVEGTSVWVRDSLAPCGTMWRLSASPYALGRRYLIALQPNSNLGQPRSADLPGIGSVSGATRYASVMQTWRQEYHMALKDLDFGETRNGDFSDEKTGFNWFWQTQSSSAMTIQPSMDLSGLVSDSACIEVSMAGNSAGSPTMLNSGATLTLNGDTAKNAGKSFNSTFWTISGLKSTGNSLSIADVIGDRLQGIALHGRVVARLSNGSLEFPAPALGSISIEIHVPSGSDTPLAYAVENGALARQASIVRLSDTTYLLSDSVRTLATRYRVSTAAAMLSSSSTSYANLSAWSANASAVTNFSSEKGDSMVVIAPDSLVDIAKQYADYRSSQSPRRKLPTKVVRLEDIYLLYSGGATDPTALRDFLRWARANWGTSHVLLFGSGSYDLRNMKKSGYVSAIPTWQAGSCATDNYFAYLDSADWSKYPGSRRIDIALGRIPARSRSEASAWLAKLKIFEFPTAGQDPSWRNTSFLVADDFQVYAYKACPYSNPVCSKNDSVNIRLDEIHEHARQTETVSQQILAARPWNFQDKIFMAKYSENAQGDKPEVRSAIISQLNQGTSLFNYIGHGSATQLAHERVFDVAAITSLTNTAYPHIFFAAACAVARFDDPVQQPLAGALVVAANRGAVASIAGMRATFPVPNAQFNKEFYRTLFTLDSTASRRTLGEALMVARNYLQDSSTANNSIPNTNVVTNQDAYVLLGDPAMVFSPVADSNAGTAPLTFSALPDTLAALYRLQGTGSTFSQNAASVVFRFQDTTSADTLRYTAYPCPDCTTPITLPPKSLLSTRVTGTPGHFSIDALTPAKLDFGRYGSFVAYAIDPTTGLSAGLYKGHVLQHGTSSQLSSDVDGPSITFRPCDSSYSAGQAFTGTAKIVRPFCLQVDLSDSSGISSATGPDEGVIVNVPGVLDTWRPELTNGSSYRQASFQMTIDSSNYAASTNYTVTVLAHDQMGNYSRKSLQLQILSSGTNSLYDVFNRPNPVKSGDVTAFYFKVSSDPDTNNAIPSSLKASIRIHTLSGKLIKVLRVELSRDGTFLPKAVWDLHDQAGNAVANGLYPFSVLLRIPGQNGSWSQVERRGVVAVSR